jgi:hypothetical protein
VTDDLVDANGREVIAFTGKVQNLQRVAELTHSIIEMAESGAWREYSTAIGHQRWLDAEYDYFLISCQLQRDDVARVLAWNADSAKLAPLMDRDAPSDRRRPFEKAAEEWSAPGTEPLVRRAERLGWLSRSGQMTASPVPKRARAFAATGLTMEERARRTRAERIPADRRHVLDGIAHQLLEEVPQEHERRYVIDRILRRHDEP